MFSVTLLFLTYQHEHFRCVETKVFWNLITEIASSNDCIIFGGLERFLLYSCPLIGLFNSVNIFCLFLLIILNFFFKLKICECCNYVLEYNTKLASAVSRMSVNLWSFIITEFSLAKSFGHKPKLQLCHLASDLKKCCTVQGLVWGEVKILTISVTTEPKRKR